MRCFAEKAKAHKKGFERAVQGMLTMMKQQESACSMLLLYLRDLLGALRAMDDHLIQDSNGC